MSQQKKDMRVNTYLLALARAGHPNAVRVMDANYKGWREIWPPFEGTWDKSHTLFTPAKKTK